MSNRNLEVYTRWTVIQDIVGPAYLWQHTKRRHFWTLNLRHFERIMVSAFVYVNGLNPVIFLEWVDLIGLARDGPAYRHVQALFTFFNGVTTAEVCTPSTWETVDTNILTDQSEDTFIAL
jgi:hypothetical protein